MGLNQMLTINKSVTEDQLLAGCQKRDRKTQRLLFDRMSPKMLGICIRYIKDRDEAEHVMIGGFVKVFEKIVQFNSEGSFEGWIRRIIVNECLMYIRKNKNMSIEVDIESAEREPDYDKLDGHLDMDLLMGLVADLPVGYRTVFNLYAVEGHNHAEIAEMLGINENTSKSQLSRARKILQTKVLELEQNEEKRILHHGTK